MATISRGFNTQPPKGGWGAQIRQAYRGSVSTHSRLKAAGAGWLCLSCKTCRFNTQPPKGGWLHRRAAHSAGFGFNTQPPKGGWFWFVKSLFVVRSFNTQPPKGGWNPCFILHKRFKVSTHSRLKAAGRANALFLGLLRVSTHSRLKAAGDPK